MLKKIFGNFTVTDYVLWGFSVAAIILSAALFFEGFENDL